MQSTDLDIYTDDACSIWQGNPVHYQEQAALVLLEHGVQFYPWSWVTTTCDEHCLTRAHLELNVPRRLRYPRGVCVYCGQRGSTRDHLIPRGISGQSQRKSVLTVPACGECNSLIGAATLFSITERREFAQAKLRKKRAKVLRRVEYTRAELAEFGPGLRPAIIDGLIEKHHLARRLHWPLDPSFDLRALQRSGIEDPYAFGLLKHEEVAA